MANHRDGVHVYTSGITNLVTITAAGMAASTALMQIAGAGASNRFWYLSSLACFFIGLLGCFVTMAGLTGQATEDEPDVNVSNVRLPALGSFIVACIGFILLGVGAFLVNDKHQLNPNSALILKLENCRGGGMVEESARLKCYDSLFDSQIEEIDLSTDDLLSLEEKERQWIKTLIIKSKAPKDSN